MLRRYYVNELLLVLGLIGIAGCQTVRMDAEPVSPLKSYSSMMVSETACHQLLASTTLSPGDYYQAGQCFEKGLGVQQSLEKAEQNYVMAARWGVPGASYALQQLGKPVPEADLLKEQQAMNQSIQKVHRQDQQKKEQEAYNRALRDAYWYYPRCYGCWHHW